jgi:hypothetical protein
MLAMSSKRTLIPRSRLKLAPCVVTCLMFLAISYCLPRHWVPLYNSGVLNDVIAIGRHQKSNALVIPIMHLPAYQQM